MQETSFYPRYKIRHSLDVLSLSLFLTVALIYSFLRFGAILENIVGLIFLLSFIVWFSRLYIRRIVFTPSYFLVERYVSPAEKINYSDVIDMGRSKIKTRSGEISFAAMSNVVELHSLFIGLMREGKIDIDQFENKAISEEQVLQKSFWPSILISTVLSGIFLVYWLYHQSRFSLLGILIVLSLIAIVVSSVVHWLYKRRMNKQ
jgi:hypothetical protein